MADLAVHKRLLQAVLSLPTPALRAAAGGRSVYVGGRTLDPRLQFLIQASHSRPPLQTMTLEDARKAFAETWALIAARPERGVRREAVSVEGPGGAIPTRLYRPTDQDPDMAPLVFAHFGGGVLGGLEVSDAFCSILARGVRGPVLSVDYRLAPEHRFPAGLEDVLAVFRHARDHAGDFGAPAGKAAIGGDSIGGAFAAAVCQELKRSGEPQPALQLLLYPSLDATAETQSMATYAAYPPARELMQWQLAHYIGPGDDPGDPRISPLKAAGLDGLAPAVVVTAGFDPLQDQGEAYARRLLDAGTPVAFRCYDALTHGFAAFTGAVPRADCACREVAGLVREGLQGRIHRRAGAAAG
jgi:acetyl esterase/lipase